MPGKYSNVELMSQKSSPTRTIDGSGANPGITGLLNSAAFAEDDGGALYTEFGGIAMPTTVFLDADGNVVDVHSGTLFEDDLRERISELFGV